MSGDGRKYLCLMCCYPDQHQAFPGVLDLMSTRERSNVSVCKNGGLYNCRYTGAAESQGLQGGKHSQVVDVTLANFRPVEFLFVLTQR